MRPHHLELSSSESTGVYTALKIALRLAREAGTDSETAQIAKALELIGNRPMSGGYESQSERDAGYRKQLSGECAVYGCV